MPEEATETTATETTATETTATETTATGAAETTETTATETTARASEGSLLSGGQTQQAEVVHEEVQHEAPPVDWKATLPEDFEGLDSLGKFKSVADLAKGYVHAESLIGREKIPMPTNDDEMSTALKRLGAPEDVAAYKLPEVQVPEEMSKGFAKDTDWYKQAALEANLTPGQASKLFESYTQYMQGNIQQVAETREQIKQQSMRQLAAHFGDKYEEKVNGAVQVLNQFGSPELMESLEKSGFGNDPELVKALAQIAPLISEEKGFDKAPARSQAQLDELLQTAMADPSYLDKSAPGHKAAKAKVNDLFQQRYPK